MPVSDKQRTHSLLSAYSADLGQLISRRRSEVALRAAALESAMANRAKSEFLANMSHELRTPLNAIIGFGEVIATLAHEKKSAGKPREYATLIAQAGRHLLEIINDILNISQIECGKFELDLRPVDVKGVVEASTVLAKRRITEKRQTLWLEIDEGLPLVMADELRLKQILINLITNAAKFTAEGKYLKVTAKSAGPSHVAFSVIDSGCGMSEEEVKKAVEPFTQIHSTFSKAEGGTGLGLTIARALVIGHGGNFLIDSKPGEGTTVVFTVPIATPGLAAA